MPFARRAGPGRAEKSRPVRTSTRQHIYSQTVVGCELGDEEDLLYTMNAIVFIIKILTSILPYTSLIFEAILSPPKYNVNDTLVSR